MKHNKPNEECDDLEIWSNVIGNIVNILIQTYSWVLTKHCKDDCPRKQAQPAQGFNNISAIQATLEELKKITNDIKNKECKCSKEEHFGVQHPGPSNEINKDNCAEDTCKACEDVPMKVSHHKNKPQVSNVLLVENIKEKNCAENIVGYTLTTALIPKENTDNKTEKTEKPEKPEKTEKPKKKNPDTKADRTLTASIPEDCSTCPHTVELEKQSSCNVCEELDVTCNMCPIMEKEPSCYICNSQSSSDIEHLKTDQLELVYKPVKEHNMKAADSIPSSTKDHNLAAVASVPSSTKDNKNKREVEFVPNVPIAHNIKPENIKGNENCQCDSVTGINNSCKSIFSMHLNTMYNSEASTLTATKPSNKTLQQHEQSLDTRRSKTSSKKLTADKSCGSREPCGHSMKNCNVNCVQKGSQANDFDIEESQCTPCTYYYPKQVLDANNVNIYTRMISSSEHLTKYSNSRGNTTYRTQMYKDPNIGSEMYPANVIKTTKRQIVYPDRKIIRTEVRTRQPQEQSNPNVYPPSPPRRNYMPTDNRLYNYPQGTTTNNRRNASPPICKPKCPNMEIQKNIQMMHDNAQPKFYCPLLRMPKYPDGGNVVLMPRDAVPCNTPSNESQNNSKYQ